MVQRLAKKPTRVTRILIDTCYSGEILSGIPDSESNRYILATNGGKPERASIALASWTGPEFTSKSIRFKDQAAPNPSAQSSATSRQRDSGWDKLDSKRPYAIITATSEGEESLGPRVEEGTFASPLSANKTLRGSFFTQAFFEYLDAADGHMEPAFENARAFTQQKAIEVTKGKGHQVPRQLSTLPADQNNFSK